MTPENIYNNIILDFKPICFSVKIIKIGNYFKANKIIHCEHDYNISGGILYGITLDHMIESIKLNWRAINTSELEVN